MGNDPGGYLLDGGAVNASNDGPIQAHNLVCAALFKLLEDQQPSAKQLQALFILDEQAQGLSQQLLNLYVEGENPWRRYERGYWTAALLLSQSFCEAYNHFLRHIQLSSDAEWQTHAHAVVAQLLHHRQSRFLLRFIRFKKRIPGQWKEVHELYRFARTRGFALHGGDLTPADGRAAPTTPEQQYLRLLLVEVMNNGQFSPREALWAEGWFSRWCKGLHLQAADAQGGIPIGPRAFVVDLDSAEGLQWPATTAAASPLFFDPAPLQTLIDAELGVLKGVAALRGAMAPAGYAGKMALLAKLKTAFDPDAPRGARHDERTAVDLAVQTIFSAPNIIHVLRHEELARSQDMPPAQSPGEGITVSPLGAERYPAIFPAGGEASPAGIPAPGNLVVPQVWQLRDRSDSGSRLRGQIDDLNRIIPGSLIAFRESEDAPWTVSVVRRFRRLMVDHVEIGVEHIGRSPRFVKLVAECAGSDSTDISAQAAQKCFGALYLPPSERQPTMPIKTLLLPECNFTVDSTVTLLSSDATYTLRLSEPIKHQFEFIWTSFIVVNKAQVSGNAEG